MSERCKHGLRDTGTNLPYCQHCDDEAKALHPASGCLHRCIMRLSLIQAAEKLIEDFYREAQIVVILRSQDEIHIRDNSGIEGLVGETLMQKTTAVMDELFPPNQKLTDDGQPTT